MGDFQVSLGVAVGVDPGGGAVPAEFAVPSLFKSVHFLQVTSVVEGGDQPPSDTKDNDEFVAPEFTSGEVIRLDVFGDT